MNWKSLVLNIPDYPTKGINFKDITPLLADGEGFSEAIEEMAHFFLQLDVRPNVLACPEARGFIFAAALAHRLKIGFIPLRKPGKLPREVASTSYGLEYGSDTLEVHKNDINADMKVMMVDDVLATGGTMKACIDLLESLGATVVGAAFLLEIEGTKGKNKLPEIPIISLIKD